MLEPAKEKRASKEKRSTENGLRKLEKLEKNINIQVRGYPEAVSSFFSDVRIHFLVFNPFSGRYFQL